MFVEYSVQVRNAQVLETFAALFQRSPQLVQVVAAKVLDKYEDELKAALGAEPGPVVRPIRWTSRRQKWAYLFTNGFGNGIPYVRKRRIVQGWRFEAVMGGADEPAQLQLYNSAPQHVYVQGVFQQGFHRTTGWINAQEAVARVEGRMAQDWIAFSEQVFQVRGGGT